MPAHGPRTLDLDLLLYGEDDIDEPAVKDADNGSPSDHGWFEQ